jgi:hypothetical protein
MGLASTARASVNLLTWFYFDGVEKAAKQLERSVTGRDRHSGGKAAASAAPSPPERRHLKNGGQDTGEDQQRDHDSAERDVTGLPGHSHSLTVV